MAAAVFRGAACSLGQCPRCGAALLPVGVRAVASLAPNFPPRRVVVVRKTTRLEYERMRNQLSEEELRNRVWEWYHGLSTYPIPCMWYDALAVQVWIRLRDSVKEA